MGEVAASTSAHTLQRPCQRKTQKMKIKKEEETKRKASKEKKQKEREKNKSQKHKTEAMFSVGLQSASSLKSVKGLKQKSINKNSMTIKGEVLKYNNNITIKFAKK